MIDDEKNKDYQRLAEEIREKLEEKVGKLGIADRTLIQKRLREYRKDTQDTNEYTPVKEKIFDLEELTMLCGREIGLIIERKKRVETTEAQVEAWLIEIKEEIEEQIRSFDGKVQEKTTGANIHRIRLHRQPLIALGAICEMVGARTYTELKIKDRAYAEGTLREIVYLTNRLQIAFP